MTMEAISLTLQIEKGEFDRLLFRASREAVSPEEYAHRLLRRALDDTDWYLVHQEMKQLQSSLDTVQEEVRLLHGNTQGLPKTLENLRGDVALTALALLVGAGKLDKEEAANWVKDNLGVE